MLLSIQRSNLHYAEGTNQNVVYYVLYTNSLYSFANAGHSCLRPLQFDAHTSVCGCVLVETDRFYVQYVASKSVSILFLTEPNFVILQLRPPRTSSCFAIEFVFIHRSCARHISPNHFQITCIYYATGRSGTNWLEKRDSQAVLLNSRCFSRKVCFVVEVSVYLCIATRSISLNRV